MESEPSNYFKVSYPNIRYAPIRTKNNANQIRRRMNLGLSIIGAQHQDWKEIQLQAARGLIQTLKETTDRCLFHASAWYDSILQQ